MKDKIKLFGWLLVFLICVGVMFFGMIYGNIKDDHGAKKLKIANQLVSYFFYEFCSTVSNKLISKHGRLCVF